MIPQPLEPDAPWGVSRDLVRLRTQVERQCIDLTELVAERVRRSGVQFGLVSVQARHTTMAVVVNENEPLLLEDVDRLLDGLAPADAGYAHDDFTRRAGIGASERRNGAAHCRSVLLGSGQSLHVVEGRLDLGRWQRVLLLELDGPQPRTISVLVMGLRRTR